MIDVAGRYQPPASMRGALFVMGWRGWLFIALITAMAAFGVAMLYSVADMSWTPWALAHAQRFAVGLALMLALAFVPMSWWRSIAYYAFVGALALLVAVELRGETIMGATRWLSIGPVRIQPSEVMKLAIVLALARYYHDINFDRVRSALPFAHVPPLLMIAAPMALIARQPDLGTGLLVVATGVTIVFLSGLPWRHIFGGAVLGLFGLLALYIYGLHDYQRARILNFLDPESDPMGSGYHRLQSLIAIGSGGVDGKGLGAGTQTQLDFLPEKHTDFIFTVIGEELGFIGGAGLLALVAAILVLGFSIALSARHQFGRLAAIGVCSTFAFYVMINVAMVMGLVPIVGVPLPLVSYGGTVMLAVMAGFGVVLSVHLHADEQMARTRGMFF